MESVEYEKMAEVEDRMWWYRGLHRNLRYVIGRFLPARTARLFDAGCGTGGFLCTLNAEQGRYRLFGLDAWPEACATTASRSGIPVVRGLIQSLPVADGAVDCLVSADVLSHEGVDPALALRELRRC